jgi:hypothetical protein
MPSTDNFYVSMYRNGNANSFPLVGPFATPSAAEPHLIRTRAVAREVDVRAQFYLFAVAECQSNQPGVLNPKVLGQ